MSATFKVGETAIYIGNGQKEEVIIQEPLQLCRDPEGRMWFGYPTNKKTRRNLRLCPQPHNLRKKDDDEGPRADEKVEVGSWDKVGWSPHKQKERTPA